MDGCKDFRSAGLNSHEIIRLEIGMKNEKYYKISSLPKAERPRELLFEHGPEYLSDQQLIAILLGSGNRGNDVMKLSQAVLELYQRNPVDLIAPEKFCEIDGMGSAKAAQLSAAMEFSRRRINPTAKRINSPSDAVPLLFHYASCQKEHFICISLNGAHEVIALRVVSIGTLNRTLVHPARFTRTRSSIMPPVLSAHIITRPEAPPRAVKISN